ncbi:MAG: polysaccharide biosynthesis protein [Thermoleophilia bacterium]
MKKLRRHINGWITRRRLLAAGIDLVLVFLAYYLILLFYSQGAPSLGMYVDSTHFIIFMVAAIVLHLCLNAVFRVYSIVNRYVGLPQAVWIVRATIVSVILLLLLDAAWLSGGQRLVPPSVVLVGGAAAGAAMLAVRFYSRVFQTRSLKQISDGKRVVLVGAGEAANILARQVDGTSEAGVTIVGLLDDNPQLRGMRISKHPVLGAIADASQVAEEYDVEEFIITIPSADAAQMENIYARLKKTQLPVRTLPPVSDLVGGRVSMADVRELKIEDILGRSPVQTDLAAIAGYLKGRRVLVTGAAGSIGSELCRQIASFAPENLILVDRDESGLYALHEELRACGFIDYEVVTTHIQHMEKLQLVFQEHRPHVVFHAAAFKHVPFMEICPDEAVFNNVLGTLAVAQASAVVGVERLVNISTDKAVDPISIMGASKRVAEMVVQHVGRENPDCHFSSVRFGNVLGSRGSMLPIFQKQIANGGPVTVTDKNMTRYFMSISEAVQLVLQAAALSTHSDSRDGVFVLEMGEPVSILEIAKKMIHFVANGRSSDIEIQFTGLRPGERLEERLVGLHEHVVPTSHPMIDFVRSVSDSDGDVGCTDREGLAAEDFFVKLERLVELARSNPDRDTMVAAFQTLVPTYVPFELHDTGIFPGCRTSQESDVICLDEADSARAVKDAGRTEGANRREDMSTTCGAGGAAEVAC